MQVEGQTYPSNGWLTTSLIAPVAVNPSTEVAAPQTPKFVLLGSQQHGNGNVRYRIGVAVPRDASRVFNDLRNFDELRELSKAQLANGFIKTSQGNEHLHVYGWAHEKDGKPVTFHLIVENAPDGHIAANIATMSSDDSVGQFSGFLNQGSQMTASDGHIVPLQGISLNSVNSISLRNLDGVEMQFDLYVDDLVVETGLLERVGVNYKAQRDGDTVKVMPLNGTPDDPYGNQPILTVQAFDPMERIHIDIAPVFLPRGIVSGHIDPLPSAPSSRGSLSDR